MSIVSSTIVFDHRARTKKGCEGPLEYRITIDRKSWYINTGVKVCRNEWKFGAVINRANADVLNERLRILAEKIESEINRRIDSGEKIDVAEIREKIWSAKDENKANDMIDWMNRRISGLDISRNTRLHYYSLVAKLEANGITCWKDVTVANLQRLTESLKKIKSKRHTQTATDDMKNVKDSTVAAYHSMLKALIRKARSEGLIANNPYDMWKPEVKTVRYDTIDYLSEDEVKKVREFVPRNSSQQKAKDLFVFQCFTGLAYSDARRFSMDSYRLINGRWVSTAKRVKTGVPFVNILLPPVIELLQRNEWRLPQFGLQYYDKMLTEIGQEIGLPIRLRSHVARHTFATMMLRNGVKIENLARMLGHTNIMQTQRYAKVLAVSVQEEFEMIEKKMFN